MLQCDSIFKIKKKLKAIYCSTFTKITQFCKDLSYVQCYISNEKSCKQLYTRKKFSIYSLSGDIKIIYTLNYILQITGKTKWAMSTPNYKNLYCIFLYLQCTQELLTRGGVGGKKILIVPLPSCVLNAYV